MRAQHLHPPCVSSNCASTNPIYIHTQPLLRPHPRFYLITLSLLRMIWGGDMSNRQRSRRLPTTPTQTNPHLFSSPSHLLRMIWGGGTSNRRCSRKPNPHSFSSPLSSCRMIWGGGGILNRRRSRRPSSRRSSSGLHAAAFCATGGSFSHTNVEHQLQASASTNPILTCFNHSLLTG